MLYVCATPIGNLDDVTLRVLDTLRRVQLIAAEDTRRTRKLLSRFDIHTPLTSLFAHNEAQKTGYVLGILRDGGQVALATDAGLPGVSDPGARLVAAVISAGLPMTVLPGASAPATALVVSGLAGEGGYRFAGYLPRKRVALEALVHEWRRSGGVVVAFETAPRLPASLRALAALVPFARAALCRELTKVHEEVARGTLAELAACFASQPSAGSPGGVDEPRTVRGEITLVVDFGPPAVAPPQADADVAAARLLAKGLSKRDAAAAVAVCLGLSHREAEALVRAVAARE